MVETVDGPAKPEWGAFMRTKTRRERVRGRSERK
jgi:hypothetical protein